MLYAYPPSPSPGSIVTGAGLDTAATGADLGLVALAVAALVTVAIIALLAARARASRA